ncbi:hypothetical protein EPUL_003882 [Erysiphe pulchra]|uniref:Uncharacterized protein n=1 Tax=Erysiphe pulchra TaxID=225359 RepID=A0A2S4PSI8_9PEZI|nr:hypothetical protein EPUL_003882 [Erysiphe pulchra]
MIDFMESTQEIQALSTEKSNEPPPMTLHLPPIPDSPPSPTSPTPPSHSQLLNLQKGVVLNREAADETLSLLNIPQTAENTRAIMARTGQKKARVTLKNRVRVALTSRKPHRPVNRDKFITSASPSTALSDKGLSVRLPQEHEWRRLSPMRIR